MCGSAITLNILHNASFFLLLLILQLMLVHFVFEQKNIADLPVCIQFVYIIWNALFSGGFYRINANTHRASHTYRYRPASYFITFYNHNCDLQFVFDLDKKMLLCRHNVFCILHSKNPPVSNYHFCNSYSDKLFHRQFGFGIHIFSFFFLATLSN